MADIDMKQVIQNAIKSFAHGDLSKNTKQLFSVLGYNTSRSNPFKEKTYQYFQRSFVENYQTFDRDKFFEKSCLAIDLIFQLTQNEISLQGTLFEHQKVDNTIIEAYLFFAVELKDQKYIRSELAQITREINKIFPMPVMIIFKYGGYLTFAVINRRINKKDQQKDILEKVTLIKDILISNPHRAHIDILETLSFKKLQDQFHITNFVGLHNAWQKILSISILNEKFYKDLQEWFYFAIKNIKLPYKPDYISEQENVKNFLVRLLARLMFCWFVKEKGLIKKELLELIGGNGQKYPLTKDIEELPFLQSNSYYRGILQNIFFNALNQKEKKSIKDFKWTKYIHSNFNYDWFCSIPYLNGGIFDKLEGDNAKESIEDRVIKIPNFLFYGIKEKQLSKKRGKGKQLSTTEIEHKGLNIIFQSYKFTLEENTPIEEDIALDPELLGLVFENLLAELDPNLEENTIKSIRKLTGSYYTPRKVIQEMVNESLFIYISKYIKLNNPELQDYNDFLSNLLYHNTLNSTDNRLYSAVVYALDKFKVLDPACGSGAFPMGMLHRIVEILQLVDPRNELWLELKLKTVDSGQRVEFKNLLLKHVGNYSRKLGIIRDSIYGIDIQPLAVQITKLRFFISLLIDQKTEKGITPMPNIETKILCADSLKHIQPDLFSTDAIAELKEARNKYYQPDISQAGRAKITNEIVDILDAAFPTFANEITGKSIKGQNKVLLGEWFNHATIAAPFFNMEFFFPELFESGGFDCIIGNPPYGGSKIDDTVRNALFIKSSDPYGAFIARFLSYSNTPTPLKNGGVLTFIVSDTFMTIKGHLPLRKMMMQNYIHKMLRVHPDTFRATVNTTIIICERNTATDLKNDHVCQMVDMTNISIHDNYEHFIEVLNQTKGVDFKEKDTHKTVSNVEYAIYYYPQKLITTNNNRPFFVASPKLFELFNEKNQGIIEDKQMKKAIPFYKVKMNSKSLQLTKLGNYLEEICGGIKSYDNKSFIVSIDGSQGYEKINSSLIVRRKITEIEKQKGIAQSKGNPFFLEFEKGGETIKSNSCFNNYYYPTRFYFPWDENTVKELEPINALRNRHRYFSRGIGVTAAGVYSPLFRLSDLQLFQNGYQVMFLAKGVNEVALLGILCSKLIRFFFNAIINHSVNSNAQDTIELPIILDFSDKIYQAANDILTKLKRNPEYDFSLEQIQIDRLVYESYGLLAEDVLEVENWYARRYPKLSAAQKENLRNLGKSDDYLVLYGLKEDSK